MSSWNILAYFLSILQDSVCDRGREIIKKILFVAHVTAAEGILYVPTQSVKKHDVDCTPIFTRADVPSFFVSSFALFATDLDKSFLLSI
jgi:hypothetical protein